MQPGSPGLTGRAGRWSRPLSRALGCRHPPLTHCRSDELQGVLWCFLRDARHLCAAPSAWQPLSGLRCSNRMGEGLSDVLGLARPHGAGMMQQVSAGLHGVQDGVQKFFRRVTLESSIDALCRGSLRRDRGRRTGPRVRLGYGAPAPRAGRALARAQVVHVVCTVPNQCDAPGRHPRCGEPPAPPLLRAGG